MQLRPLPGSLRELPENPLKLAVPHGRIASSLLRLLERGLKVVGSEEVVDLEVAKSPVQGEQRVVDLASCFAVEGELVVHYRLRGRE